MSRSKEDDCMEEGEETIRLIHDRCIIDSLNQSTELCLVGKSPTLAKRDGWTASYSSYILLILCFSLFFKKVSELTVITLWSFSTKQLLIQYFTNLKLLGNVALQAACQIRHSGYEHPSFQLRCQGLGLLELRGCCAKE